MDPFKQPVNAQPQAITDSGPAGPTPDVPGLDPIQGLGKGVKPPADPAAKPARGLPGGAQTEELEKLLVPATAAAGAVLKPEGLLGKKLLTIATGFKVGEAGAAINKPTPGVAMFLLPEPLGVLPERFFMAKPRVPGTRVYLDPLYNFERYQNQREQRLRAAAGAAQLNALQELVPGLTTDQLRTLRLDSELQRRTLTFADPRAVDSVLQRELDVRRGEHERADATALAAARPQDPFATRALVAEAVASALTGDVQLLVSLRDFIPAGGSIQPEAIEPVSDAARRNQAAARGINRDLVSERADP